MLATVTIEVPSGTEIVVSVELKPAVLHPTETSARFAAPLVLDPQPRGPRGQQLWLRYPGWECDASGWRRLEY